ncbi:MAG: hypothetical protein DMG96_01425 [Acidobacteria bacterium]|nr:MAG: hypothetical protein DMG96_01425 [Acidobacteriota bacterium]
MEPLQPVRADPHWGQVSRRGHWIYSAAVIAIAAFLLLLVIRIKLQGTEIPRPLITTVAVGFFTAILIGTYFLVRALREYSESEERFQQMATNIHEIFWMIDAPSKRALYVNPAYEAITGRSCSSLFEYPMSYEEVIHPGDRDHVLSKLDEATTTGQFNERFRIVGTHGEVRWVHVRGFRYGIQ